jgi:hypothetical protein
MLERLRHLIHGLPFEQPVPEHLREEFEAWPAHRRRQLLRKVAQRELAIALSGQRRLRCHATAPAAVRRMLWWTTWTTIGDAIMDLSPRFLLPAGVEVELMISPALAPLFAQDSRFTRVHTGWDTVDAAAGRYDFLLVNHFSTDSLRDKRRHLPQVPFAAVLGHMAGEMFSRLHVADARVRQLFGLPPGDPLPPRLDLAPMAMPDDGRCHVAVALGARDERRRWRGWNDALLAVLQRWPAGAKPPCFHLLGTANARPDREGLSPALLATHCVDHIERQSLLQAAQCIAGCDAFVGPDGGPMHVAVATGRPGVAMFSVVPPEYRLLPGSPVWPLRADAEGRPPAPEVLAQALVDRVHGAAAQRGLGHAHDLQA